MKINLASLEPFTLSDGSGQTQVEHHVVDLNSIYDDRSEQAIFIEVITNDTAPGADRTLDFFFAFAWEDENTFGPEQLQTAAEQYTLELPNDTDAHRVYVVPNFRGMDRYLHYWFNASARDAGSELAVQVRVNSRLK